MTVILKLSLSKYIAVSRLRMAGDNRLNKLICKASDVVGMECDSLTVVSD